jgi:Cu/Ag efflux pump CusA
MLGGITVGNLFQDQKVFDVVVWAEPGLRDSVSDIEQLLIDTPDGRRVRLGDVADVQTVSTDAAIRHASATRFVEITANVSGRSVGDAASDVEAVLDDVAFPLDHHAELLGDQAARQDASTRLIAIGIAVAIAIFLLLQAAFRSWSLALVAFVSIAVALSGALVATLIDGGTVTIGTIAGLLAVGALATRAIVLLLAHLQDLRRRDGMALGPDLVVRGVRDRLVPTVLSALATIAALAPIAVLGDATGLEIVGPAVVAVIGGVLSTAAVVLFAIPAVYLRLSPSADADDWEDEMFEKSPVLTKG